MLGSAVGISRSLLAKMPGMCAVKNVIARRKAQRVFISAIGAPHCRHDDVLCKHRSAFYRSVEV